MINARTSQLKSLVGTTDGTEAAKILPLFSKLTVSTSLVELF